ncbi:hypothetical protein [Azospirillum thermophilum]|uniref:Uncharacterized protein n=1 Tax=Azospirillum thermophilum TaxID=2202148 RepID=A0A2S2CQ78_9PROT|nr:hypothetical protein [Azospirillum thermophilum]AWK86651.1 hypothetical protein DEW08_10730 [Azospirillum thermophilum]
MAGHLDERLAFPTMLDPVLTAPDDDDAALESAINEVAEALADSGALVLDAFGRPAQGATDEEAVLGLLDTYVRVLLHLGEVEEASTIGDLIDRIHRLDRRRKRRNHRAS